MRSPLCGRRGVYQSSQKPFNFCVEVTGRRWSAHVGTGLACTLQKALKDGLMHWVSRVRHLILVQLCSLVIDGRSILGAIGFQFVDPCSISRGANLHLQEQPPSLVLVFEK